MRSPFLGNTRENFVCSQVQAGTDEWIRSQRTGIRWIGIFYQLQLLTL